MGGQVQRDGAADAAGGPGDQGHRSCTGLRVRRGLNHASYNAGMARSHDETSRDPGEPGSVASGLLAVVRQAAGHAQLEQVPVRVQFRQLSDAEIQKLVEEDEAAQFFAMLGEAKRQAGADAAAAARGGWLPFDRFMALALYQPGLGYYANSSRKFGSMPGSGSDFVTAPELSPLFGRALAAQVGQALAAGGWGAVLEFGAGSGALAEALLDALGDAVTDYAIVDLSGVLRQRQQARLARFGGRVRWLDALPDRFSGVVVGNEVLDAMPVQLLHFDGQQWRERGVAWHGGALAWADRPRSTRRPRPSSAPWPACCSRAWRCSSTTASPRPSTTCRSATAAR